MTDRWVSTDRFLVTQHTDPLAGRIKVQFWKAIWVVGHGIAGSIGIFAFFSWPALAGSLALTTVTICVGTRLVCIAS